MLINRSSFDLSRPAGDKRNADAAFVQVALDAAQLSVRIEELRVGAPFFVRPVIAGEKDNRVVVQSLFLQVC